MQKRFLSILGGILIFIFSAGTFEANAQRTLADTHPQELFRKGEELFNEQHFGSAQDIFNQYLKVAENQSKKAEAMYYIAVTAMELFQDDAEVLLNKLAEEFPEHPRAQMIKYYQGKFLFRKKEYEKAIIAFEQVDEYELPARERGEFYFMAGYSYFQDKKYDKAKELLAKVKDTQDRNATIASYYYGYISYEEGKYNDALAEFNKIKEDRKFKNIVPVYIAQIYLLQGNYDKVIEFGEAAVSDKSTEKSDDIKLYIAEAYYFKKNYAKAVENYASYNNSLPEPHLYKYGFSLFHQENYAEALKVFTSMQIKEDSLGQNVAYHLGAASLKTGNKPKARSAFEFASKQKFDRKLQEQALFNYAKLSYDLNFQKEGIDAFKLFIKNYPNSKNASEAKELLSQILLATNNAKEALEVLESMPHRSDRLDEAYQKILYTYGVDLFKDRKYNEASQYFNKSLKVPEDRKVKALAYFWLGESQYKQDNYDDALTNYKNFLYISEAQETPYYNLANYNIGYCYFKQSNYQYANTYFQKYYNNERSGGRNARYLDAVLRSADCQFVLKNYGDALQRYNEIIDAKAPEADYAFYQKGIIQGLQGNSNEKVNTLRNLTKRFPNSAYLDDAIYAIGEEYMKKGNASQAIAEFTYLNQDYPKNPYFRAALLNTGMIYYNQQNDEKAVPIFRNIVQQYPYSAEAKQALKAIQNSYIDRGMADSLEAFYKTIPNQSLAASSLDSSLYSAAFNNIKNNDCKAAIKSFETYLSKYPNGYSAADASYYLAECAYKLNDKQKALQNYNNVISKSPNAFVEKALKNSAEIYYENKAFEDALKRYQQLEEIANNRQNVLLALNGQLRAHFFLKQYDRASEVGNKLLNLGYADEQSKIEAQFYIAKSHLELNQLDQALASFEQVYKQNKTEIGAEAMYQVAYINFLKEKYKESQDLVMKLKDDFSYYDYWKAKAFILLADISLKTGDTFTAKNTLQSIVDNYEKDDDVRKTAKEKLNQILENEKQAPK